MVFMQCAPSLDMRGAKAGQQHLTSHVHRLDALYASVGFATLTDYEQSKPNHRREERASNLMTDRNSIKASLVRKQKSWGS